MTLNLQSYSALWRIDMKACVLEAIDKLVYKEVPTPEAAENEVLVHIKACGICSSDYYRVKKTGTYHFPTIPGHEFSGEIVAVGKNVDPSFIGRRAVIFPLLPCRICSSCAHEDWTQCKNYNYFGSRCDGGFAEYIAIPLWNIKTFSTKIPFSVAALAEPASVAWHAVSVAGIKKGDSVCISGSGTIAILCGLWAREQGASQVFLICRNQQKKEFIEEHFGFQTILEEKGRIQLLPISTLHEGADIVLECVGTNISLENSLTVVRQRGTIILAGNPAGNMALDKQLYWKILRSELTLKGTWNSTWGSVWCDWDHVLQRFENLHPLMNSLITHKFYLKDCTHAFDELTAHKTFCIKGMFIND